MKFVVGENGRNPEKNLPRPRSATTKPTWRDRDLNSGPQRAAAVGGERLTACATRPPITITIIMIMIIIMIIMMMMMIIIMIIILIIIILIIIIIIISIASCNFRKCDFSDS